MAVVLAFPRQTEPQTNKTFAMRVPDDALSEVGIHQNDLIEMERTDQFKSGDLVAFLTFHGECYLMFAHCKQRDKVLFTGASRSCPTRIYNRDEVIVIGVAT